MLISSHLRVPPLRVPGWHRSFLSLSMWGRLQQGQGTSKALIRSSAWTIKHPRNQALTANGYSTEGDCRKKPSSRPYRRHTKTTSSSDQVSNLTILPTWCSLQACGIHVAPGLGSGIPCPAPGQSYQAAKNSILQSNGPGESRREREVRLQATTHVHLEQLCYFNAI